MLYKDRYQSITVKNGDYEILYNEDDFDSGEAIVLEVPAEEYDAATLRAMANGTYQEPEQAKADPMTKDLPEMFKEMGAVIHIKRGDLQFASVSDTFDIEGVEGYYRFDENVFLGQDGIVGWENVGIPKSEMKVRLSDYKFNLNQRDYTFENAIKPASQN